MNEKLIIANRLSLCANRIIVKLMIMVQYSGITTLQSAKKSYFGYKHRSEQIHISSHCIVVSRHIGHQLLNTLWHIHTS